MTDADNIVIEQLPLIRNELSAFRAETGDHFVRLEVEIGALGQQVAGLATAVYAGHDRFRALEARIGRIEARLELADE